MTFGVFQTPKVLLTFEVSKTSKVLFTFGIPKTSKVFAHLWGFQNLEGLLLI
jgi:hypothetical protein